MTPNELLQAKRAARMQDAANGLSDLTAGNPFLYAIDGDNVWIARIMTSEGADLGGMWYAAGDILLHRMTWNGQTQRLTLTQSATVPHKGDGDYTQEAIDGIHKWDPHVTADMARTIPTGEHATLSLPDGTPLACGWSDAHARADDAVRRLAHPGIVRSALMQQVIDTAPKPLSWWTEDYGYGNQGLYMVEWHRDESQRIVSYDFTHMDFDAGSMDMENRFGTTRPQAIGPFDPDDTASLQQAGNQLLAAYQKQRNLANGAPEDMPHPVSLHGISRQAGDAQALRTLTNGHVTPDWNSLLDEASALIATNSLPQARTRTPQPPAPRPTRPAPRTAPATPAANHRDGQPGRMRIDMPASLVRPYTRTGRDGRQWHKMIVQLPAGTQIEGLRLDGWAFDRFMSPAARSAKDSGQDVRITLKSDETIELFRGKGSQRRATTVPAQSLARAIDTALHGKDKTISQATATATAETTPPQAGQPREADPLSPPMRERLTEFDTILPDMKTTGNSLAAQATQYSWQRVARLQDQLHGHMQAGTYQPALALKAAQRVIDHAAVEWAQHHGKPDARSVADSGFTPEQRQAGALILLAALTDTTAPPIRTVPPQADPQGRDGTIGPHASVPEPAAEDTTMMRVPIPQQAPRTSPAAAKPASPPSQACAGEPRRHAFKEMVSHFFTHEDTRQPDKQQERKEKPARSHHR